MKKLFALFIVFIFMLSGCASKTAAEKFGKIPIEELPKKYEYDMAVENGDYVRLHGEIFNEDVMDDFLEKVENKKESFVRTVEYTYEGDPIIIDFYYNKGEFKVRTDWTRDAWGGRTEINEEQIFKYLKTDVLYFENFSSPVKYLYVTNLEEIDPEHFPGEDSAILKSEVVDSDNAGGE